MLISEVQLSTFRMSNSFLCFTCVSGAGTTAAGLWNEQSQVVVETVTKTSTTQKFASVSAAPGYNSLAAPSDPSRVSVSGAGLTHAMANKEMTFKVDASQAG